MRCAVSPLLECQSAARPHNSPLTLRVVHFVSALRVCGQGTQPTVVVGKGKSLTVACYAPFVELESWTGKSLFNRQASFTPAGLLYSFRPSLTGPTQRGRSVRLSNSLEICEIPNARHVTLQLGITLAPQNQQRSRLSQSHDAL